MIPARHACAAGVTQHYTVSAAAQEGGDMVTHANHFAATCGGQILVVPVCVAVFTRFAIRPARTILTRLFVPRACSPRLAC
jgi:hypothetical protein